MTVPQNCGSHLNQKLDVPQSVESCKKSFRSNRRRTGIKGSVSADSLSVPAATAGISGLASTSAFSFRFVTKVTADAGENARMSFAGFFTKPEKNNLDHRELVGGSSTLWTIDVALMPPTA